MAAPTTNAPPATSPQNQACAQVGMVAPCSYQAERFARYGDDSDVMGTGRGVDTAASRRSQFPTHRTPRRTRPGDPVRRGSPADAVASWHRRFPEWWRAWPATHQPAAG